MSGFQNRDTTGRTYISEGTTIKGNIISEGDITIKGTIDGNIDAEGDVTIAGSTQGDIKATNVIVESGSIVGKIDVEEKLDIVNADRIEGEIETRVITVKACSNFTASIKTKSAEKN